MADKDFKTLAAESQEAFAAGDHNRAAYLMREAECAADAEGKLGPGSSLKQGEKGELYIVTLPV